MINSYRIKSFSWHITDQLLVVGIPRLVIFPYLASVIGTTEFGLFVLALTTIQMVGLSPSNGFQGWILRELENYPDETWDGLAGWASVWSMAVALPFVAGALLAPHWAGMAFEEGNVGHVILAMGPYLFAINAFETGLSRLRVRRKLSSLAGWHGFEFGCILLGLILLSDGTAVGAAWGFSLGGSLAAVFLFAGHLPQMVKIPSSLRGTARHQAISIWWPMSLSAILGLTATSIDRLLVGVWLSAADVAVYYAAASLASLAGMPFGMLGGWFTTMLGQTSGGIQRVMVEWRRGMPLLVGAIVALTGVLGLLGEVILGSLYPEMAIGALAIWWILVIGSGVRAGFLLVRPIVVKFASPKVLPAISSLSLLLKVMMLVMLIPNYAVTGAAYATLFTSIVVLAIWWLVMAQTLRTLFAKAAY